MSTSIWNVAPYPLHWPEHRDRTPDWQRRHSQFSVTFGQARSHLLNELGKMGARHVVISSNLPVRQDGLPLAAVKARIDDPGVAVYFQRDGQAQCIPCDQWHGVLANLRAIGKTVEALRGVERWGAKAMLDAAMAGFVALPMGDAWWRQLGVAPDAGCDEIERAFRGLAKVHHPDAGGWREAYEISRQAYETAKRERGCA
jgi:hypothetical protein